MPAILMMCIFIAGIVALKRMKLPSKQGINMKWWVEIKTLKKWISKKKTINLIYYYNGCTPI